jgi:hypothetical protein
MNEPWTIRHNPALTDRWSEVYTLYWMGLVRGQLVGVLNSEAIVKQLNLANVDGGCL